MLGPYQGVRHQGGVFRRKPPSWRHRDFVLPSSVVIIDDGDSSEYSVPIVSIGPSVASVGRIADFLLYLFRLVREINSLRGYRLVIAAIHSGFSRWGLHFGFGLLLSPVQGNVLGTVHGTNLGSPVEVFLGLRDPRGASFRAPLEIGVLLRDRCSLELLTLKRVFFISLASGRRRGAIRALSTAPGHFSFLTHRVRRVPQPSLAKSQTIVFLPHPVFIPKFLLSLQFWKTKVWCPGTGTSLVL